VIALPAWFSTAPVNIRSVLQFRRLASFILGAWLAGSVLIDAVAIQNFRSVERFLDGPAPIAAQDIHTLGRGETRVLLRHLVAEQNRYYFEHWEWVGLGIGLCFLFLLILGSHPPKVSILLALAMVAIVLGQRVALTPQITRLGRALDFVAPNAASPERTAFWTLHGIYSGLELLKLGIGFTIAGLLMIRRNPDRQMFARESEKDEIPASRRSELKR